MPPEPITISAIVAITIALMHQSKGFIGTIPYLREVPTSVYVVVFSIALTGLANLGGVIEGPFPELAFQALFQATSASGVVGWYEAGLTPVKDSEAAQDAAMLKRDSS